MSVQNAKFRPKLMWVSVSQVISMLIVVFSHSIPSNQYVPEILVKTAHYSAYSALSIFMWISGYLVIKTNALEKYGYWNYLKKRFVRLILPFVCISILMLVPKYLLSAYSSTVVKLNLSSVYESIMLPRQGILPHLWFLPTLMLLSILSPLIAVVTRRKITGLFSLTVTALLVVMPAITNFLCLNDLKLYLFWYISGFFIAQHLEVEKEIGRYVAIITGLLFLIIFFLFSQSTVIRLITNILALISVLGVSLLIPDKESSHWSYLSNKTFTIYILHLPIQNIVEIIFVRLGIPFIITVIGMFSVGVIIPSLIVEAVSLFEKKTSVKFITKIIGM